MYEDVVKLPTGDIHTPHCVRIATADGQVQYTLTGVLAPHLSGIGNEWCQRTLRSTLPLDGLDGAMFTARQWAPSVAVAAANTDGPATNAGWAVDGFGLVDPETPCDHVVLDVYTSVRDAACRLLRITYQITLVGTTS